MRDKAAPGGAVQNSVGDHVGGFSIKHQTEINERQKVGS